MPELDPPALPDDPATLDAILAAAWARLERGAAQASEDWHWPVLASIDSRDPERPAADARVVVLRRADSDAGALEIHSDLRAHKLAQLDAAARACLVFHDRESGLQLRAWGATTTHAGDALARRAWERLGAASRRSYLAPRRPGEPVDVPDINQAEPVSEDDAGSDRTEPGLANFAAIVLTLDRMEWLRLGRGGHQRARFDWQRQGGTPVARWIRP